MDAQVRFTGLNYRWNSPLNGKVILVGADKITNEKANTSYYRVDVRVDPPELTKLAKKVRITPGMPASVMIVTGGYKTVMGDLISPITDTLHAALHDQ
jgi:HlyD family secretion protein